MFAEYLSSTFRFRKTTVSLLLVLTYSIIGLLYIYDRNKYKYTLPGPDDWPQAPQLLDEAWLDLQHITKGFHPYFSRENDEVHDYLLERIQEVTASAHYASISDDAESKRSTVVKRSDRFNSSSTLGQVFYFESANILVKLEGQNPSLPGLLLSAHYDSVPTAHGATDDGKGIVSLLGLLNYYSQERPDRTLIFNFNDNEEFGLLGSEAFFSHKWSKLVQYVINLEGTGTGGRPVLFRTSDVSTAKIYQKAVKRAPFGNSIYQQGFYEGKVNSETDFLVYTDNGLRGFDIAFYKPRDFYHTVKDSIQYTSREALWSMFNMAWQITDYMAKIDELESDDLTPAVFFDINGTFFVAISARSIFRLNCLLLVIMPLITVLFDLVGRKKSRETRRFWNLWLRLPLSLIFSIILLRFTQKFVTTVNPFLISRDYLSPLFAFTAEFVLTNYFILSFFEYLSPTQDFKTVAFRELSILLWLSLLIATINLYKSDYRETGIYPLTFLYILISMGCSMGYICRAFKKYPTPNSLQATSDSVTTYGSQIQDEERQEQVEAQEGEQNDRDDGAEIQNESSEGTQLDERAPLLQTNSSNTSSKFERKGSLKDLVMHTLNYDWSIQFLITLPLAIFIAFNCADLILSALNQTIQEGTQATTNIWNLIFICSVLISIPLLPFSYKLNYIIAIAFSLIFSVSLMLSLLEAPFTEQAPLKVRFSQTVNLNNGSDAIVNIFGRKGGFISSMLQELPSIKENGKNIWCEDQGNGNEQCSYIGISPNAIDFTTKLKPHDMFSLEILKNDRNSSERSSYAPINAELKINVKENRACTLWFNSSSHVYSPVRQVTIFHDGEQNTTDVIKWSSGITELQLHKLDFEESYYHVGLQWLPKILATGPDGQEVNTEGVDALGVSVRCYWADYDSESIVGDEHKRKLPAYDELLEYSPLNITFSNREKGLLMISEHAEL